MKGIYFNKPLQNDDVFVKTEIKPLAQLTGYPTRKGIERAIIAGGQLVNVVSQHYAHLPNERYFAEVERQLIEADINYTTRSINRNNGSFAVDYILQDERYNVTVKNGADEIKPMLRFTNSYDGSTRTAGNFGFFRKVCNNGLHISHQKIGFAVKHKGDIAHIVLPKIAELVNVFMDNEFYALTRKFEAMSNTPVFDLQAVIKDISTETKLFKYEISDTNPDPSLNARLVREVIDRETALLNEVPNKWHVYNAFNELLHGKLKKTFESQRTLDQHIFERVLAY